MTNTIGSTVNIGCEDEYEAEKLMWILSPNREQHILKDVAIVSEKELILILDDDSSHSISLSDKESALMLQSTLDMILIEGRETLSIRTHRNMVRLEIE